MTKEQLLAKIHTLVQERRVLSDKVKSLWSGIVEVRKQRGAKSTEIKNLHAQMRAIPRVIKPVVVAPAPTVTPAPEAPKASTPPAGIGSIAAALKKAAAPAKAETTQVKA